MTTPFVLAVPSKGRLQENAEAFFARAGLGLAKPRGARDYRGTISGVDNVEIAYLSASEIAWQLARGAVHLGVATQTPNGLMVPVVRHAEALSLHQCAREARRGLFIRNIRFFKQRVARQDYLSLRPMCLDHSTLFFPDRAVHSSVSFV